MDPLRIAYVIQDFPKLSETFIAGELAELRRRGIEVQILSREQPRETLRHSFIAEHRLDRLVVYGACNFSAALGEFQPDLIHAHFANNPTANARLLAAEFGVPFTFTAHGSDIYYKAPRDFADRAASAAAVITVSEANARYIATRFGVPRERIRVIPCGVDTGIFCRLEGKPGTQISIFPALPPLILCVARHTPVKNLGLLLEACAMLRDRGVEFRCVMIGDGASHDELAGIRAQLNLQPRVEMIGAAERTTVLAWLRRASVAVLSSHSEGMPVSLMEAGACEVPVVATRVGGIPELIEDGVTGILTTPGDVATLTDALQRLVADQPLRAAMGHAARRRIAAKFSLAAQIDSLQALWSRVLAGYSRDRTLV